MVTSDTRALHISYIQLTPEFQQNSKPQTRRQVLPGPKKETNTDDLSLGLASLI